MRATRQLHLAVCLTLAVMLPGLTYALWPEAGTRSASPMARPRAEMLASSEIGQRLHRFALNALLVPMLDEDEHPARWANPALTMHCDPGTRVHVDGKPVQPGAELSGRSFTVRWQLERCLPFGVEGPELTGPAELLVFRDDDALTAVVRLHDVQVRRGHVSVLIKDTVTARTP